MSQHPLAGRRIAILEHRELDRLGGMLEAQGAETVRVPLIAIADSPNAEWVITWLRHFIEAPPDYLVLMTGEGLRRLNGFAERVAITGAFREALGGTRTVTRGPKPAQALRALGLAPGLRVERPTTDGVVAALGRLDLGGCRVGVQLYPEAPATITDFVANAGGRPDPVWPYVYVPAAGDAEIRALIAELDAGRVDAVAFTSAAQVVRLFVAAERTGLAATLDAALRRTAIAAVGPVVATELARRNLVAAIMPRDSYFMKPLVSAIIAALGR